MYSIQDIFCLPLLLKSRTNRYGHLCFNELCCSLNVVVVLYRHQREKRICSWLQIFRVSKSCLHHNLTPSQTNLCHTLYKHRILPSDSKRNKHVYNIRTNVFLVKASLQARKKKASYSFISIFVNFVRNDWYHCMMIVNIIFLS